MNALAVTLIIVVMAFPAFASGPPAYWGEELSEIQAVTGSLSGAVATARAGEKRISAIRFRLSSDANYRGLKIKGRVSSLLFMDDDATLLAVVRRQAKRETGDTYLLKIDTATTATERLATLPRSAAGMTWWPGARHVLVSCKNEIRSFKLPGFRSGPLYQLFGGNLAIAHHSGPVFLVSRTSDLVLVNLEDPQGEVQIPVRKRFSIAGPLLAMEVSSEPTRLYGVTLDGVKIEQSLDVEDLSAALLPSAPASEPEPNKVEAPHVPVMPEEPAVQIEPTPPDPEPEPEPQPEPVVEAPPLPAPVPAPEPEPQFERQPEDEVGRRDFQVYGTIQGAAATQVESVLILGPNNILREAARVQPGDDGRWGIGSLQPGRYRVVLDGGGGQAILSEPRFATIQVIEGEALEVPPFEAQRVR